MISATKRQQEVMAYIQEFIKAKGFPPTYAEIATAFGFSSVNSVACHVKALTQKGLLSHEPNLPRTLRVLAK